MVPDHMGLTTECVFLDIIHEYAFFWSLVSYLTDFRWCSTLFPDILIIEIFAFTHKKWGQSSICSDKCQSMPLKAPWHQNQRVTPRG